MGLCKFLIVALCALMLSTATGESTSLTEGRAYYDGARPANSSMLSPMATTVERCTLHTGVDFKGGDIGNAHGTVRDCCEQCKQKEGCDRFTWTDYNGGTCWLKSKALEYVLTPGAVSGVVLIGDPVKTPYYWIGNTNRDMPTFDLWNEKVVGDDAVCAANCARVDACNAFAYTAADSTCYFKSAASPLVVKVNVFAALVFKYAGY